MVIENATACDAGGELVQAIANKALVDPVDPECPEIPDNSENRQRGTKNRIYHANTQTTI